MLISTKGRYALRVLIDLAERYNGSYIPIKEVAYRQDISLKYLEQIMPVLSKGKLVVSLHGKGGGYRLIKEPEEYTVYEVLLLTEGDLAPVRCLECNTNVCIRSGDCRTLAMWKRYHDITKEYFSGITLAELMRTDNLGNYII